MCVLSIKVPIRKKSGNLFNDPRIYIYIYIYRYRYIYISKLSSQCPRTVGVDYSLHRIYEGNHINLRECSTYGYC